MIRNSRRVVALAVAGAVAIASALSGCAAGDEPESASPTRLTEGVNVQLPTAKPEAAQIALRNMFLLGADRGTAIPPGSSVALYGALINQVKQRPDRLVSVSSPAFSGAQIKGGSITIPAAADDGTGGMVKLHSDPGQSPTPGPTAPPTGQETATPTPAETGPGATSVPTQSPTSGNTVGPQETGLPVNPVPPGGGEPLVVLTGLKQELLPSTTVPVRMQFEHAGTIEFDVPVAPHQDEYATYPVPAPAGQGGQPTGTPAPGENTASPAPGGSPEQSPGATASPGATGQ